MSDIDDGGPAFPGRSGNDGISAEVSSLRSRLALLEKVATEARKCCADSCGLPRKGLLEALKDLEKP